MEGDLSFDTALNVFSDASITTVNGHYTSCSGYVIVYNDKIIETNHRIIYDSTNNYGEIFAIMMAVSAVIKKACEIKYVSRINLFSDSQISVLGLRDWIFKWYKKLNRYNNMISERNVEIANQDIFTEIVRIIVENGIPIHLYHQLGHKVFNNNSDIKKIKESFKKVNGEEITDVVAQKLCWYNNVIDKFTRDNLMAVTTSLSFDLNNYQKDIIDMRRILDDNYMEKYSVLIYKTGDKNVRVEKA